MNDNPWKIALWALLAGFVMAVIMVLAMPVHAHSFYDYDCCSDNDCQPVPASDVIEGPDGYEIPSLGLTVPYGDSRARPSPDGKFHLCFLPFTKKFLCIYAPQGGV